MEITKCPFLSIEDIIKCSLEGYKWSEATDIETTKDNLAYIIRTSGSADRPKQCKISHSSLAIIANAWAEKYKMDDFTVNVLQWAPLSFDVFVGDFVRGLICTPGQLTICPDRFRLDVFYVLNLIREHKAEVTPQFGLQLVENASGRDLESLQLFILGSDKLQYRVYKKFKNLLNKDQRLINSYRMTEATIDSSFFEGSCPRTRSGTVPIGKPLPGVYIHIDSVGHGNGITAPTASSQQKVTQEALNAAEVKPSDITFVECHGTGTMLGDKIELSALGSVFNEAHNIDRLPIGSIKSIFGHLDSAAGLLGLFKVLTSFMTKQIAPTAHFKTPHPELYVPSKTLPWDTSARVAGVSSFGLTGTNCHVVVSEFSTSVNESEDQETGLSFYPQLFSGNTVEQIRKQVSLYKTHIQQSILQTGRNTLPGLPGLCLKKIKGTG